MLQYLLVTEAKYRNMSVKTRTKSGTKIGDLLGGARSLLPTELPTVRACLQAALQLQEEKFLSEDVTRNQYTVQMYL